MNQNSKREHSTQDRDESPGNNRDTAQVTLEKLEPKQSTGVTLL